MKQNMQNHGQAHIFVRPIYRDGSPQIAVLCSRVPRRPRVQATSSGRRRLRSQHQSPPSGGQPPSPPAAVEPVSALLCSCSIRRVESFASLAQFVSRSNIYLKMFSEQATKDVRTGCAGHHCRLYCPVQSRLRAKQAASHRQCRPLRRRLRRGAPLED